MKLLTAILFLIPCLVSAQIVTGLSSDGQPIKIDPVTEEEYAARKPISNNVEIVRDEANLVAAINRGSFIQIPNVIIDVVSTIFPSKPGIVISGLSKTLSGIRMVGPDADRVVLPLASDLTFENLTISGGTRRVRGFFLDGRSRIADRLTIKNCLLTSCSFGVLMDGAAVNNQSDVLEDFTFINSRIEDFSEGGIYMMWEIERARIQNFFIRGLGAGSSFNGIWIGLGVVDSIICDGVIQRVGRMGLESFYSHHPESFVTKNNLTGPSVNISNLSVAHTGSMGVSITGCKRSVIHGLNVRKATAIGVEFVDEIPGQSNYLASSISVSSSSGTAISIDKIRGGIFSQLLIDGVSPFTNPYNGSITHRGLLVQQCDDVTVQGSRFTNAGLRYVDVNISTKTNIVNNQFTADWTETVPIGGGYAIYVLGGDCYFNSNRLRTTIINPLRCGLHNAIVSTSPTAIPLNQNGIWVDGDNWRGTRYVKP